MYSITCNKIVIIDAIGNHIDDYEQRCVASSLYQTLNDKISDLQTQNDFAKSLSCELVKVRGKEQWNEKLTKIEQDCKNGVRPIIHFVSHGLIKGMQIADRSAEKYEIILWDDVYSVLTKINIACHNNLFVSMCVCHGFWSMIHLLNRRRIPFCGLLASPDAVSAEEVNNLIPAFYIELLEKTTFTDAKKRFEKVVHSLEKDGVEVGRWYIKQTDMEFVKAVRGDYERRSTLFRVRQIAKKEFKRRRFPVISEAMIRWFIGMNFKYVPKFYQEIRDELFMRDLYPEEYTRFNLPTTYDKLRRCPLPKEQVDDTILIVDRCMNISKKTKI